MVWIKFNWLMLLDFLFFIFLNCYIIWVSRFFLSHINTYNEPLYNKRDEKIIAGKQQHQHDIRTLIFIPSFAVWLPGLCPSRVNGTFIYLLSLLDRSHIIIFTPFVNCDIQWIGWKLENSKNDCFEFE